MHNFIRLLKVRLDESFDISRFKYSNDPGLRIGTVLYKVVRLAIYIALFLIITRLYDDMARAGLARVLPTMSYFFASMACVFATIININEILTGNEDSEFLLSTPISGFAHVAIMFMTLYVRCLAYVLLISGPAAIIYIKYVTGMSFLGYWIEGALMTSLPLGGISCLIGTFIVLTLAHHPRKEQIQSGITISCIVLGSALVLFIINKIGVILNTAAANSEETVNEILKLFVSNLRFPRMYQYAIVEHSIGYMVLFPFLSLIWYIVFSFAFGLGYRVMIISFRCPVDYKEYEWVEQEKAPQRRAIFRREFQQLLRSKTYMTKTMTGIIVGTMLALSTLFFGAGLLTERFSVMQIMLLICFFVGLSNSTYYSLSIEGRRHWITETSPMNERQIFESKVHVNLIFTMSFSLICGTIFAFTVKTGVIWGILYVVVPMMYSIITAHWGIWADKKFGDFSKESEQQAMHQGLSYVLGYLPGVLLPVIMILLL